MPRPRKRKRSQPHSTSTSPATAAPPRRKTTPTAPGDPFPSHSRPTPDECLAVRDTLLDFHGFPEEFAKYRNQRLNTDPDSSVSLSGSDHLRVGFSGGLTVLDGLVSTILSQNTTDLNSQRAFASLKSAFPTWEDVLAAEAKLIEHAIRCGGLAPTKASCIKNILRCLKEKKGKLCLEYLRDLTIDEIKAELSCFKGIGPKTVACVLMFHLQQDDFPVDTHIFQIAKTLGWVPGAADVKKTYLHLNQRIPNELKFDLNCLMFAHGKLCSRCSTKVGKEGKKESNKKPCPLLNYCKNSDQVCQ